MPICDYCYQQFKDTLIERKYTYREGATAQYCSPECYDKFMKDQIEDSKYDRRYRSKGR
jgi:hypothetical protein